MLVVMNTRQKTRLFGEASGVVGSAAESECGNGERGQIETQPHRGNRSSLRALLAGFHGRIYDRNPRRYVAHRAQHAGLKKETPNIPHGSRGSQLVVL